MTAERPLAIGIDVRGALWYRGSGIGTYTFELVRTLSTVDHRNRYILACPDTAPQDGLLDATPTPLHPARRPGFWSLVKSPADVALGDLDVYHVPHNGVGWPRRLGRCRLVVTIHDLIPYVLPQTCSSAYLKLAMTELPQACRQADLIITVSNRSREDLKRFLGVQDERIRVIYEAPSESMKPQGKSEARARLAARYGYGFRFILYLGGFSLRKNLFTLLDAYERLRRMGITHRLVLAGKPGGGAYPRCLELVETLGIREFVMFPGFLPSEDLPAFYSAADLFVYPSLYEGFGLPPVESMACGTPVVASNVASLPEVLGDAAALVDPYDAEQLTQAMFELLTDEASAQEFIARGRARARELSWSKAARETVTAFKDAALGRVSTRPAEPAIDGRHAPGRILPPVKSGT